MTQQSSIEQPIAELTIKSESKQDERPQISIQELIDSLKSTADDVGQICELTSEERLLVTEFFKALLILMQPLAPDIAVSTSALPSEIGNVTNAYMDPTGHLALIYEDGHLELKNLSDEENRDLLVTVIRDVMPKFKQLTSAQKSKIGNRIKFLSAVTNKLQKISGALLAVISAVK